MEITFATGRKFTAYTLIQGDQGINEIKVSIEI